MDINRRITSCSQGANYQDDVMPSAIATVSLSRAGPTSIRGRAIEAHGPGLLYPYDSERKDEIAGSSPESIAGDPGSSPG